MCSRGSVAVIEGDRSSATTIAGAGKRHLVRREAGEDARDPVRHVEHVRGARGEQRVIERGQLRGGRHTRGQDRGHAVLALLRIRDAAPSTSVGSQAIAAWAMKIAASSSCPVGTDALGQRHQVIRGGVRGVAQPSLLRVDGIRATRPPTGSSRRRTCTHGPRATPGAAATPASRTAVNPMPPPPDGRPGRAGRRAPHCQVAATPPEDYGGPHRSLANSSFDRRRPRVVRRTRGRCRRTAPGARVEPPVEVRGEGPGGLGRRQSRVQAQREDDGLGRGGIAIDRVRAAGRQRRHRSIRGRQRARYPSSRAAFQRRTAPSNAWAPGPTASYGRRCQ